MEQKEQELLHFTEKLQTERLMSEEERSRLINEISFRETQVAEMRSQVDYKTNETNRLQMEVEEQRQRRRNEQQKQSNNNNNNNYYKNELQEHNGSDDFTNVHVGKFDEKNCLKISVVTGTN